MPVPFSLWRLGAVDVLVARLNDENPQISDRVLEVGPARFLQAWNPVANTLCFCSVVMIQTEHLSIYTKPGYDSSLFFVVKIRKDGLEWDACMKTRLFQRAHRVHTVVVSLHLYSVFPCMHAPTCCCVSVALTFFISSFLLQPAPPSISFHSFHLLQNGDSALSMIVYIWRTRALSSSLIHFLFHYTFTFL